MADPSVAQDEKKSVNDQLDENQLLRLLRQHVCRICQSGDQSDTLITPCLCQGPFAFVHKQCVEKWISESKQEKCDICLFKFNVTIRCPHFFRWFFSVS